MNCTNQEVSIAALALGLFSTCALALAVATDFWLYTSEPVAGDERFEFDPITNETIEMPPMYVSVHSGLWRVCVVIEYYLPGEEPIPSPCMNIAYFEQEWKRVEGADTTNSILRAIRHATPLICLGLLSLCISLGLSVVGSAKRDGKTLVGAVMYITSALALAVGIITYLSAVNDELSHFKPPQGWSRETKFIYHYQWAFFFAGFSFVSSMASAVTNIALYMRRYSTLDDMAAIIPGLDEYSAASYKLPPSRDATDDKMDTVVSF